MRGKDQKNLEQRQDIWITPAYAGKSFSGTLTPKTDSGSPPPMRGKATTATIPV